MIDTLIVPDTVRIIADRAFCRCTDIKRVILPESVEHIGNYAFASCTGLEKIEATDHLLKVEEGAFNDVPDEAFNKYEGGLYLGDDNHPYHCFVRPVKGARKVKLNSETTIAMERALWCDDQLEELIIPLEVKSVPTQINTRKVIVYDSFPEISSLEPGGFDYATDIVVLSAETGEMKYEVPLYSDGTFEIQKLHAQCWRPDNSFDFAKLDGYFDEIYKNEIKTKIALKRVREPYDLDDNAKERYLSFLHDQSRQIVKQGIEDNDLELLHFMGRNNLIKKNSVKPMIAMASEQGKTAVTAFLLDYNNRIMK